MAEYEDDVERVLCRWRDPYEVGVMSIQRVFSWGYARARLALDRARTSYDRALEKEAGGE